MKTKITLLSFFLFCSIIVQAQTTYVPDDNFEQALIDLGYDDVLDDYVLTSDISGLTSLDVTSKSISDLTGIEGFISLTNLNCGINQLTSLDLSQTTSLVLLECHRNELTSLNISQNTALQGLYCNNNELTILNVSQNIALSALYCNNNKLTDINISQNTALTLLGCDRNELTSLNVNQNTALQRLYCYNNQLTNIDLSQNTALIHLECHNNQLSSLNINNNTALTYLRCLENQLTSLDLSQNIALTSLMCSYNQLTSIDLSKNTALKNLTCRYNQFTSIDVSNNIALTYLSLYDNQLSSLDVSQNSALTRLYCQNNQLISLDVKNGNNSLITSFDATNNPSLTCIQVDNETDATDGLPPYDNWQKDATASYSEDCLNIEYTYVPDDNFEQALIDLGHDDVLDDYVITANISGLTRLYVYNKYISDLTGIEDFISLTELICAYNQLTSIDLSQNIALTYLSCHNNQLTSIDVSQNMALTEFYCHNNQLTSLDLGQNTALTHLVCGGNHYTSLDVSQNTALTHLTCGSNHLASLDVSQNTALTYLGCTHSQLTGIDVSQNIALTNLYCYENLITSMDVSQNTVLTVFNCYSNRLTSLDISQNTALTGLNCLDNQLTSINLKQNPVLAHLWCRDNLLTSLDVSQNATLTHLYCYNNQLTSLDLRNGNNLNLSLSAEQNSLSCINVDDETADHSAWHVDPDVVFSNDCDPDTQYSFVTGGGWINSPEGAYLQNPDATGKANFGFVCKYKKGSETLKGNTIFHFNKVKLKFKSTSYDSLSIIGAKAVFKGSGTIKKKGDYGFLISVIDGNLIDVPEEDRFRIKIWDKKDSTVIYDNEPGIDVDADATTVLGGGSIVIHIQKTECDSITDEELTGINNEEIIPEMLIYPNPAKDYLYLDVTGKQAETIQLKIFNSSGALIHISTGKGIINEEIDVSGYNPGLYVVTTIVNGKIITKKILINK